MKTEEKKERRRFGEGKCYKCGKELGWYDTKILEQEGERMVCYPCWWCNGFPAKEHEGWCYYTDG